MKQAYKKITAWILTLVMAVSVFAVVPARQVKAAGDKINLISEEISGSGVKANTEGKYQVNFNNTRWLFIL